MSLSGNLGFVSLDEVLRLLNRSNQRGMVDVKGDGVDGRIFFDRGGVTLATTFADEHLADHIARSETPEGTAMSALLREMAVETLHQLAAHGRTFDVVEQRSADIGASTPFDLEELLADARRRYDEWAEVSAVVTDLDTLLKMQRDLGERDRVTIDRDSWRLLSEIGPGASVRTLASQLGTTDFWAARVAAGLVGEELLGLNAAAQTSESAAWSETAEPAETAGYEPAASETTTYEPAGYEPVASEATTYEPAGYEPVASEATTYEPAEYQAPAAEADAPEAEVETPAEDEFAAAEPVFAETSLTDEPRPAESDEAAPDVDPNASWWTEPEPETPVAEDDTEEVEEDTEAFLEKVFSGLDSNQAPEEGYGLLRRRRLGALRDLSNDS